MIKKQCPNCPNNNVEMQGAVITSKEIHGKIERKSFNHYKCPGCKRPFLVERTNNLKEQKLTEHYIKSAEIKLKK